jgi:hypothetical protein
MSSPEAGMAKRPHSVLLISDQFDRVESRSNAIQLTYAEKPQVPSPQELAGADVVLILGPLSDGNRALELAGATTLALEQGAVIVFAYSGRFQDLDNRFLASVVTISAGKLSGSVRPVASEPAPNSAFREYLTLHGQTDLRFSSAPDDAEVLAHSVVMDDPRHTEPTALAIPVAAGTLYIVPYHLHSGTDPFLERLVAAVMEHREATAASEPSFFDELELPEESDVRGRIARTRADLEALEEQRMDIVRHKLLVGHLQGQSFEDLVRDELDVVLAGSGLSTRDELELFAEDFLVVDEDSDVVALCEAKGLGRGIARRDVDQVNAHRTESLDRGADELPGLLIVNAFRNDDTLERRRERVGDSVVRHARRMNVLVMRSWDLYQLVARRLAGADDSGDVREALVAGGGWLEVDEDEGPRLRTG